MPAPSFGVSLGRNSGWRLNVGLCLTDYTGEDCTDDVAFLPTIFCLFEKDRNRDTLRIAVTVQAGALRLDRLGIVVCAVNRLSRGRHAGTSACSARIIEFTKTRVELVTSESLAMTKAKAPIPIFHVR